MRQLGLASLLALLVTGCAGDIDDPRGLDAATRDGALPFDSGPVADTGVRVDARVEDGAAPPPDAGSDGGPADPCEGALFCERFDDYTETDLVDGQRFGPWRAAQRTPGSTMSLDGAHTTSGTRALHVRIEEGERAGGRLFASGALPIFEGRPTQLYGRMMMYIEPNGSSVHWTFFGASGDAVASSPVSGRRATYLISSLPRADVNTYSFVYGLSAAGGDPYRDCYFRGPEPMPTARWTCVAFEMDSEARRLRLATDGAPPIVSVDETGAGCVGSVPGDTPWYGPQVEELYVGAWSFHPMVAPLEVWIDDVVIDTDPVACPAP